MKKFTFVLMTVAMSMAFVNCSSDDDKGGEDCLDCSLMGINTKYCHSDGNDFYTMTVMGQTQNIPLEGSSWSDVKVGLQEICN